MSGADDGNQYSEKPLRFVQTVPVYRMSDEARDTSPEGLAYLYALTDLQIFSPTSGCSYLKTCMLEYFKNREYIDRSFADICASIAEIRGIPYKDVCDGIRIASKRIEMGFDYWRLSSKYGLDPKWDNIKHLRAVDAIHLFCEMAWRNYKQFPNV